MFAFIFTPWFLVLNFALCFIPVHLTMKRTKHLLGNPELNKQYYSFARFDYPDWDIVQGVAFMFFTLCPLRFLLGSTCVLILVLISIVFTLGHQKGTPIPKWRMRAVKLVGTPFLRLLMLCFGVIWIDKV